MLIAVFSCLVIIAVFLSGVSFHSVTALCLFSFCLSAPSRDAKPSVQLPDHSGRAANTQPRSHWQPAKQYGQPDARHDGPVPSNAVLSGILIMRRFCKLSLYECRINISSQQSIQFILL